MRPDASTASSPLVTTSTRHPNFSSIRNATRWFTTLSSATRTRARSCPSASRNAWRVISRDGDGSVPMPTTVAMQS